MNAKRKLYDAKYDFRKPHVQEDENETSVEWKVGLVGLILGLSVIIAKLYTSHNDYFRSIIFEKRLINVETISEDGQVMMHHMWKNAVKYSSIWVPVLSGVLITYFTGLIVYLDSNVPGVQPPSPFSPTKYKAKSGHTFHSNYILAVIMGFLVALYMYWREISL